MCFEELCDSQRIVRVFVYADIQSLQTIDEKPGIKRRLCCTKISQKTNSGSEGKAGQWHIDIDQSMIRRIRLGKEWVSAGMALEKGIHALSLYDNTSDGSTLSVGVFAGGVNHDIDAPIKRATECCRGDCVVTYRHHTVLFGYSSDRFDISHRYLRIGQGFKKYRFCVVVYLCFQVLCCLCTEHLGVYAKSLHSQCEQCHGPAIELVRDEYIVSSLYDIGNSKKYRTLTTGNRQCSHTALQLSKSLLQYIVGRVGQSGVDRSQLFECKEVGGMLCIPKGISSRLGDRHTHLSMGLCLVVSCMYGDGLFLHFLSLGIVCGILYLYMQLLSSK